METVTPEFRKKFLPRELYCWKSINHPNHCYLYREFRKFNYQFSIMDLAEKGDLVNFTLCLFKFFICVFSSLTYKKMAQLMNYRLGIGWSN